jgi:hypothetical protein
VNPGQQEVATGVTAEDGWCDVRGGAKGAQEGHQRELAKKEQASARQEEGHPQGRHL